MCFFSFNSLWVIHNFPNFFLKHGLLIKYNLFQKEKAPNHNDSNLVTLQFGEPKIWEEQNNEENCVSVNVVQFARLATYFEYIYIYIQILC